MPEQSAASTPDSNVGPIDPLVAAAANQESNADSAHHLLYKGASGEMAVMSEFLYRQINVAVPMMDAGDDVFVVKEKDEAVTRVQVKYSKAMEPQNGSYFAQFTLPWQQFDHLDDPRLVYVLAVRNKNHWTDFVVVGRSTLQKLQADHDIGTISKDEAGEPTQLALRLVFTGDDVRAKGGYSLEPHWNAFEPWPPATT